MVIEVNKSNRKESAMLQKILPKDGKALEKHPYVGKKWCKSLFLIAKILLDFLNRQKDKKTVIIVNL